MMLLSKLSLRLLLLAGLLAGVTLASFAGTSSYYLDRSRLELTINPQTNAASGSVKVISNSATPLHIKIVPKIWTLDENASIRYLEPPATGYNLLKNILINPQEFELPAGKTQMVRFLVRVPADVTEIEYPFQLIFEPTDLLNSQVTANNNAEGVQSGLNVVPIFTTTVYAYKGNPQPNVTIDKTTCEYNVQKPGLKMHWAINNTGSKHARLYGSVILSKQDASGTFQPIDLVKLRAGNLIIVFPNLPRMEEQTIIPSDKTTRLEPGVYRLSTQLSDERNSQPAIHNQCDLTVGTN